MYAYLAALVVGIAIGGSFEHFRLTSQINEMKAESAVEQKQLADQLMLHKEHIAAMSDQLALSYATRQTKTDVKYKTITKEVDRVVQASPDSNCRISDDWVRIYNEALQPTK